MSSILHQAVQLAQAGNRTEARQLLWQFIQTEPNNEVAWLWLASVAQDQTEYQRALNEVLRINPANPRAQQLLAEFQQQFGAYAPPQQQVSPPPVMSYAPPPQQQVSPPPMRPQQYGQPSPPIYGAPQQPVEVQVKTVQKRSGCGVPGCGGCLGCGGCGQGCIIAFIVLVILPVVICGGLSFSPISLGPFDVVAGYLPGQMGRKTINFETDAYNISVETPRSWVLVETNDQMWAAWRDMLESTLPFREADTEWKDLETAPGVDALIVDINPATLGEGGNLIGIGLVSSTVSGDYLCDRVRAEYAGRSAPYEIVHEYKNNLCGVRDDDQVRSGPSDRVFTGVDAPDQERTITFVTPVNATTALQWQISLPDKLYSRFEDDIEALIESVETDPK